MKERFNYIESFKPDAEYRGIANYNGYVVFCFENKKIYILDSAIYGHAIYIFSDYWKKLSKLSKQEIIRVYTVHGVDGEKWTQADVNALQKENAKLREELEILKRSALLLL